MLSSKKKTGFTLIEVLVVVALMSIILTIFLGFGSRQRDSVKLKATLAVIQSQIATFLDLGNRISAKDDFLGVLLLIKNQTESDSVSIYQEKDGNISSYSLDNLLEESKLAGDLNWSSCNSSFSGCSNFSSLSLVKNYSSSLINYYKDGVLIGDNIYVKISSGQENINIFLNKYGVLEIK